MKNPILAFVLNFFVPGAGLCYLGKWLWGSVNLLVLLGLAVTIDSLLGPTTIYLTLISCLGMASCSGWFAMHLAKVQNSEADSQSNAHFDIVQSVPTEVVSSMEPLLGQIQLFPYDYAPKGWAFCDGKLQQISQNAALFALLGTGYGGDGLSTFALPNINGKEIDPNFHYCIALQGIYPARL